MNIVTKKEEPKNDENRPQKQQYMKRKTHKRKIIEESPQRSQIGTEFMSCVAVHAVSAFAGWLAINTY